MFIEVTRSWLKKSDKEARELININEIKSIEPLPEKNGYGEPQSGSRIHYIHSTHTSEVDETYEEMISKLEWAMGRVIEQ
jgi:hypothetical protein